MARGRASRGAAGAIPEIKSQGFLDSPGLAKTIVKYGQGETLFTQGEACNHVMYIQEGGVKLSVRSETGREVVLAMLGPGDFLGEGCLAGQPVRVSTATAIAPCVIVFVSRGLMARLLHEQRSMSDRFITHMLVRNIRIEKDLIDQRFDSSEKRLAGALLLLARYGQPGRPVGVVLKISPERLADMIGTTRSRVNFFLKKFTRLGFIEYSRRLPLTINSTLLSVVLSD